MLVLGALLGAAFTLIVRTDQGWRRVLGGVFYGVTVWGVLQYALLPPLFPLVAEKGFPPFWYGVAFAVYGLTLGVIAALSPSARQRIPAVTSG